MTMAFKGLLRQFWQPQLNSVRFKVKFDLKRPKPPHFTRAKVEKLCEPYFPKFIDPSVPMVELCQGPERKTVVVEDPYETLLGKSVLEWFNKSKYILFFHMNAMKAFDFLEARLILKKCGIDTQIHNRNLLNKALTGTIYEASLILFQSHTVIGCGNDVKLAKLIKDIKKTQIFLMAGIIDCRLLSLTELQNYSNLPDIQTLRASLVSVLNSAAGNVVQQLNHHPSTIAQQLHQHVQISQDKKS